MLGLYVSGHPLDGFEESLALQTDTALTSILANELPNKSEVTIGGIISSVDRRVNKDGLPWAIVDLEDHNGASVEVMVFARTYAMIASIVAEDAIVLVRPVQYRDDRRSLVCDDMKIPELGFNGTSGIPLRLRMRTDQCTPQTYCPTQERAAGIPGGVRCLPHACRRG